MENFNKLKELIEAAETEADKFYNKKVKAAGSRLRGHMQEIKNTAQAIRTEVSEIKAADRM